MSSEYAFQVTGLNKRFGPTHANKDIDFTLKKGEVRGLAGENGSGKSTLLSQLAGIYSSDSGTILKDGEPYAPDSPLYAQQHGVSIVVQELGCIGALPAGINVFLGRTSKFSKFGIINMRKIYQEIDRLEKSKLNVKQFSKKYEAYQPFALIAVLALLLEILLRITIFRRIP